jgi:glycosyltransferase involved in cell wall biosynthesis
VKEKLLIVTDAMEMGGVENVLVNTLTGVDYSKFDITLFIMYRTIGETTNLSKIPGEVKIKYLFEKPVKDEFKRLLFYSFVLLPPKIMNRLIVREYYDIIITTKNVFSYPISTNKCSKIMWVHGGLDYLENEKTTLITKLKRSHKRLIYNKFDKVILLTNKARKTFCEKYKMEERTFVLDNPINSNEIIKLSKEPILDYSFKKVLNIVCCCRLSSEKGLDRLITSCEKLIKEGFSFHLIIIGDGPEKEKLSKIIMDNPALSDCVSILGFKENPYKYLSKCDIYISPSLTEGYSLSIAEAIILELPVMSTNCSGPEEILDKGYYGLLVENSEKGIYKGLKTLLTEPELVNYYKMRSKERKSFFTYENSIKRFEEILL